MKRLALAFALSVAACATTDGAQSHRAPLLLSLERTGCPLGSCPSYLLELRADGWLTYNGRKDVTTLGLHSGQLTDAEINEVKAALAAAGFYELDGNFECIEKTDAPTVTVGYHLDGRHRTLVHFHGCMSVAQGEKLSLLEDELDKLLGSEHWVK